MSSAESLSKTGMIIDIEKEIDEEPNSFDFVQYIEKIASKIRGQVFVPYKTVIIRFEEECALSDNWCSHYSGIRSQYCLNPQSEMCTEHKKRHVNLRLQMLKFLEMDYTIIIVGYLKCAKNRICYQWIPDLTLVFNEFKGCKHSLSTYYLSNTSQGEAMEIIMHAIEKFQPDLRVTMASKCPCS